MSDSREDIVRRGYQAFADGDMATLGSLYTDDALSAQSRIMGLLTPNIEKLEQAGDLVRLADAAHHRNGDVRVRAARALASLARSGNQNAVDVLIDEVLERGTLTDLAPAFTQQEHVVDLLLAHTTNSPKAREALVRLGPPAIEGLRAALASDELKQNAVSFITMSVSELGSAATPLLVSALEDPKLNTVLRRSAIQALGALGATDAADTLFVISCESDDPSIRAVAATTMMRLGAPRAGEALTNALQANLERKDEHGLPILIDALAEDHTLEALDDADRHRIVELLAHALPTLPPLLEERAVPLLGVLRDPAAVDALLAALDHRANGIAARAADALGTIGDPRAVGPLRDILLLSSPTLRERAEQDEEEQSRFYERMSSEGWVGARVSFDDVRASCCAALVRIGGAEAERVVAEYEQQQGLGARRATP